MDVTPRCFGAGLSYRAELHRDIARHIREIDFLEVVVDDFIGTAPDTLSQVTAIQGEKPVVAHGLGMSLGAAVPVSPGYLDQAARIVRALGCRWHGEHLSFSNVPERDVGMQIPLWYTEETLEVVRRNVRCVKEHVSVPILLENVTYYYPIPDAEMSEAEFLSRAAVDTDSGLLLDINTLHINSLNLGFDPYDFLSQIPLERVVQVHIAGGHPVLGVVVDTHGARVHEEVWRLLAYVVRNSPVRGVTLEWDYDFPPFSVMREHLLRARLILRRFGAVKASGLMSLLQMQTALARILTDADLRDRFFSDPDATLAELDLTPRERASLKSLDRKRLAIHAHIIMEERLEHALRAFRLVRKVILLDLPWLAAEYSRRGPLAPAQGLFPANETPLVVAFLLEEQGAKKHWPPYFEDLVRYEEHVLRAGGVAASWTSNARAHRADAVVSPLPGP